MYEYYRERVAQIWVLDGDLHYPLKAFPVDSLSMAP